MLSVMNFVKNNFKYLFLLVLFGAAVLVWYAVFQESRSGLMVAFLDVGQGDAIFIQAENGNQILIDGGPDKSVFRELSKVMPFYDRSLDMIIFTHPDSDHIGGIPEILERYKVDLIMGPDVDSQSPIYREIKDIEKEKNIKDAIVEKGMKISLDDGAYIDIIFPLRSVANLDDNDMSVVAKLVYSKTSFLFTGDSPQKIENYLVSLSPEAINTDILKVGHHGSRTSSSESFIGYASPEYAVISSGKGNRYGHPHKEVLNILDKFEVKILRTDLLGSIIMKSDGENVRLE